MQDRIANLENTIYNYAKKYNKKHYKIKTPCNKIIPRLFIGNINCSEDCNFFKSQKIKAVLNCSKDIKNSFKNSDIEYSRIRVDDSLKEKDFKLMLEYSSFIVEFIHKHVDIEKSNILVHCAEGMQRSVTSVVMYLMKYHNMSAKRACTYVLSKRASAFYWGESLNFAKTILLYEDTLSLNS